MSTPSSALISAPAQSSAVSISSHQNAVTILPIKRTSALKAPILLLEGHGGEVFSNKFSPDGQHIASGSFDRSIFLWNTYGDSENYAVLNGHAGPILELHWSRDGSHLFSASTDKTLGIWDTHTGTRVKKFKGHTNFVNTCCPSRRGTELLVSGSDDCSARIWDAREKHAVQSFAEQYPVTATCWNEDGTIVFVAGIDNEIKAYDLRKNEIVYRLKGHLDTVTGLRLSPDGTSLLSNAMDNTIRTWNVKPFAVDTNRMLKIFEGAPHGFEKNLLRPCWSSDGDFIAAGSADRSVVVWDVKTRNIKYKLPGHKGCVNEVDWHPTEPIIVSGSNDKTMFVGELDPEDVRHI